jgi:hypothetical protein
MTNMSRYVILRHEMPPGHERRSHWDLMLEDTGVLRTWALEMAPDVNWPQEALALADHRLAYLEFEGPHTGARGSVARWDEGAFATLEESDAQWAVELKGKRLRGRATLIRLPSRPADPAIQRWAFSFWPEGAEATGLKPGSHLGEPSELPRVVRPAT